VPEEEDHPGRGPEHHQPPEPPREDPLEGDRREGPARPHGLPEQEGEHGEAGGEQDPADELPGGEGPPEGRPRQQAETEHDDERAGAPHPPRPDEQAGRGLGRREPGRDELGLPPPQLGREGRAAERGLGADQLGEELALGLGRRGTPEQGREGRGDIRGVRREGSLPGPGLRREVRTGEQGRSQHDLRLPAPVATVDPMPVVGKDQHTPEGRPLGEQLGELRIDPGELGAHLGRARPVAMGEVIHLGEVDEQQPVRRSRRGEQGPGAGPHA